MKSGDDHLDLQECLTRLGAKRVEAALLAAMISKGSMATHEVLQATGLRQPEVSVGMRSLRERQWIDVETIPREGKGRPMYAYKLTVEPKVIRKFYEDQGKHYIHEFQVAMQSLRAELASAEA